MKRIDRMWGVSLVGMGLSALAISGSRLLAVELPDLAVRALGAACLISLFAFGYASAKKLRHQKKS